VSSLRRRGGSLYGTLLLPFTLVNVAAWMHPPEDSTRVRAARWLVYGLGMLLTASTAAWLGLAGMMHLPVVAGLVAGTAGMAVIAAIATCVTKRFERYRSSQRMHRLRVGLVSDPSHRGRLGLCQPARAPSRSASATCRSAMPKRAAIAHMRERRSDYSPYKASRAFTFAA
jgi:hypothetical protein